MNYYKLTILLILLGLCASSANAQKIIPKNLVPNPSFEQHINLPLRPNIHNYFKHEPLSGYVPFPRNTAFWKSGNKNTPDLRIVNRVNYADCRKEFEYCVKPRTGQTMAGIISYMSNSRTDTYREYISLKLKAIVQPGIKTFVELWICKDRKAKLVCNNIGFYYSQRPVYGDVQNNLVLEPQYNCTAIINQDTQRWEKISGWFIPSKPYLYLTIGNFYDNEHTLIDSSAHHSAHPLTAAYASYLIDDVRVWQEGDSLEEEPIFKIVEKEPIQLQNITFETNSAQLKSSSLAELNKLLTFLQKNPKTCIAIHGHTDNMGTAENNVVLSQARAQAVVNFLTTKGIAEDRLTALGFGASKPIASNQQEAGRLQNRRVEFVVVE